MDCRKCLVLALGLMALAGCTRHLTNGHQDEVVAQNDAPTLSGSPFRAGNDNPKRAIRPGTFVAQGEFLLAEASQQEPGSPQGEKQREQARQSFLQALRADPNYLPAHVDLARYYESGDEYERAVASYRKVLEIEPKNHPIWNELGMCQARKKDWVNALASLGKAVELDPENRQYNSMLGFTLARAGQYDQSLACFTKVQGEAMAHYNLARMLQHLKQPDLCKAHLQMALVKKKDFTPAQILLAQLNAPVEPAPVAPPAPPAVLPDQASLARPTASQAVAPPAPAPVQIQPVSYQAPSPTAAAAPAGSPSLLKIPEVPSPQPPASLANKVPPPGFSNPSPNPKPEELPAPVAIKVSAPAFHTMSPPPEVPSVGVPAELMITGVTSMPLAPTEFTPLLQVDKKNE